MNVHNRDPSCITRVAQPSGVQKLSFAGPQVLTTPTDRTEIPPLAATLSLALPREYRPDGFGRVLGVAVRALGEQKAG